VHPVTRRKELIDVISNMARERQVYAHELRGIYVILNDRRTGIRAVPRESSWLSYQAKSLVIPTLTRRIPSPS